MLQDITKALIVAGLAFWLITNAFVYIVHVFSPARAIVFSKFETADTDLGQQCPKILSSTFEQFRHPSPKGVTTTGSSMLLPVSPFPKRRATGPLRCRNSSRTSI